jgi:hypothetical protein
VFLLKTTTKRSNTPDCPIRLILEKNGWEFNVHKCILYDFHWGKDSVLVNKLLGAFNKLISNFSEGSILELALCILKEYRYLQVLAD